jgi:signal transduction histidine kinase
VDKTLQVVERLALASQEALTPVALLENVCTEVAAGLGFDRVVATAYSADTREVWVTAAHGVSDERLGDPVRIEERPLLARALRSRELVFVADVATSAFLPETMVRKYAISSVFTLPLFAQGHCLGFLSGDRSGTVFRLDAETTVALRTIGVLVATLLQASRLDERGRRLDAAKSEFIALASHELRTPVAVMYGITSTLLARGSQLAQEQLMSLREAMHEQTTRLRLLVDHLLDLSRLDALAITLKPQRMRVRNRIEELVLLVAERRAGEIAVEVDPLLEADVDADALDRVLSNLLANALKYGEPPVTVSAQQRDRHFRLVVEDCGPGVPEEFVEHLFDRFSRAHHPSETVAGSGLGLAIARAYAHAHGGDILYTTAKPHGARFELVVPQQGTQ